jgi:hypothetical protein
MAIVRVSEERAPLTPEQRAELNALAEMPDEDIDYGEIPEWTEEQWARSVMVGDYPSRKEAMAEARHLHDMQMAGMAVAELEAYKASRAGSRAAQTVGV